jgi:DNA-binding CsgD family transcriptional regulator
MGKSRLLAESVRMARRLALRFGSGAAEPVESAVELAPLSAALFAGPNPLLHHGDLRGPHAQPVDRYWWLQDVQAALEAAALESPLLVCLDDAQWADAGTAAALRALPARLAALPIVWVVAFRPDPIPPPLLATLRQLERGGAERIVLSGLDDAAVVQVARDVMHAEPDQALLSLAKRAHGNPFLLIELLTGIRDEHLVRIESGRAELVEDRLPRRVHDSMREQLRAMDEPVREAAVVAASLGRRFAFADLATMLDHPPSALLSPVQALLDLRVLVERDEQLAFRHDIIRDAIRAGVPASARRALDRQAADVLLATGATPVEVATQLAASAEPGDEVAITTLFKAAATIAAADPGAAVDLSRRALALAAHHHPLRGPLVAQTAVLLHEAGRAEEARTFADTSLREALPPEQEAEVRLSIASMFAHSPDVRAEASRQALALPGLPPSPRARHLAYLAYNLMMGGRPEEAAAALAEGRAAGGGEGAAYLLDLAEAGLESIAGRFEAALALTATAARSARAEEDDAGERLVDHLRALTLMTLDRPDEALELLARQIAVAQRDRHTWALHLCETSSGRLLLQRGRLHDAAAVLEGQLSPDDEHRYESILEVAGVVALGRAAIHLGDARLQRMATALALAMADQGPPGFRRQAAWLLALQAMAGGDAAGARARLVADEPLGFVPIDVTDAVDLVRIAIAAGDGELAESAVSAAERRCDLNPGVPTIAGVAAHTRGLLTGDERELSHAVQSLADGPRPLALASALEDLGVARLARDAVEDGIAALDRALSVYVHAGAAWDAGRVRSRLRAQGVRRRVVSAERPARGWAALTDSELAVARLVAEGRTNREVAEQLFVSPHTVGTHLRHVFAKLDINSRVELIRLARDFGTAA